MLKKKEYSNMNKSVDWSEWILQKNSEFMQEELKKSEYVSFIEMLEKAPRTDRGHSVFHMEHIHHVLGIKDHGEAKKFAHDLVDKSTANDENKRKIKYAINKSKNQRDLAFMMNNHLLAHPSEGLSTGAGTPPKKTGA